MEQLGLWILLQALGYAGAASLPQCCNEKSVGGVSYKLVEEMDTVKYRCKSNCVFEREGSLGSRFCFKEGDLEVVCKDDDAAGDLLLLRPGLKIGTTAPPQNGFPPQQNFKFGSIGAFVRPSNSRDIYILTNAHVVDFLENALVYLYYQATPGGNFLGSPIGQVYITTDESYKENLDLAVIRIANPQLWIINYNVDGNSLTGSAQARLNDAVFTFGAKSEAMVSSEIDNLDATAVLDGNTVLAGKIGNVSIRAQPTVRRVLSMKYQNGQPTNLQGDSGSVLVRKSDRKVIGLFFALTIPPQSPGYACHITDVLSYLAFIQGTSWEIIL